MIVGVGIDVVPVDRFAESLARTPGLADRLFTAAEQRTPSGADRGSDSLAARFAAKEALAKALGGGGGMLWTDAEVGVDDAGRPLLHVRGTVARRAAALHVTHWHVSLSHDGGVAAATVIAEARDGEMPPDDSSIDARG
ncbi:MAG TPA: holo-ACP synthase [Jatrophihabitantaceae bacterium]